MKPFIEFFYESEIDPNTPYEVVDTQTGEIVWKGTYAKRNVARRVVDRRDNQYGGYRFRARFSKPDVIKEYRHNLADGTAKPSVQAHNGKNPNRLNKKKLHTVGPYKPLEDDVHKQGKILIGDKLMAILAEYNIEFEDGGIAKIKNSPNALKMSYNQHGQPTAIVFKVK
jgi:hypothetical protein